MTDNKLFIHPGFGKSGTTTLQANLFARHRQILSLGRPYAGSRAGAYNLTEAIDGIGFDIGQFKSLFDEAVKAKIEPQHSCMVLSDEILISNAYLRAPIAKRIKAALPGAQVIFTIRNQISAAESYYANHGRVLKRVPKPYLGRQVSLENWLEHAFANRETSFLGLIDYCATIECYEGVFGKDNVRVFLFEEMTENPKKFATDLCAYLDVDAEEASRLLRSESKNRRVSHRLTGYAKLRDHVFPNQRLSEVLPGGRSLRKALRQYLSAGKSLQVTLPEPWESRFYEVYRNGNARLAESRDLPLADHGYPI